MSQLPTLPSPGVPVSPDVVASWEARIVAALPDCDDIDALEEQRAKAMALETWLRGKDLAGPMLGAQRRIEARIGQLLGDAQEAQLAGKPYTRECKVIPREDRNRFRLLARGWGVLSDEEWRQSRTALIAYLREKLPVPKRVPLEVVGKDGKVKKARAERANEIAKLAKGGARAAQIAEVLNIGEQQVRKIAKECEITLVDAVIGGRRQLDTVRILEETISGVGAYVDGLKLLEGVDLPGLDATHAEELMSILSASIAGLRKLHHRMGKSYARSHKAAI
jgi:hypothetical protein